MILLKRLAIATVILGVCSVGTGVAAEQTTSDADHKAHHPTASKPVAKPSKTQRQIDEQMKQMHAMHEKMMNAKTPEERAALMDDQMKSMQSGMHMMDVMRRDSEAMPMSADAHRMMMKRMDMMQMMMQAMMDRQSAQGQTPGK
ncbi:hypothetical protein A9R05_39645 (plasmid) [Burkholderia sp. KK1]|nr:hypothetical protein A9R05_39645 [Burkholderia sp. KK1]